MDDEAERAAVLLVGRSPAMRAVRLAVRKLADVPTTVLVTGETGTGKSLVARALHVLSARRKEPFLTVDCAALPPTLVEVELFGCEAGAYTGARRRAGRAERAGAGVLFLDEVAELEPPLQAKLLTLLEDRRFERVGGSGAVTLRARVVAATNANLEVMRAAGTFRDDLYYRLHVAHIHLPPLRERPEDVPLLVEALAARLRERIGPPAAEPGAVFETALAVRAWPGNVRELANALERWWVLGEPPGAPAEDGPLPGPDEAGRIAAVLRETGGNVSRAARRLGLARTTLRRRIRRYGLSHLRPRD